MPSTKRVQSEGALAGQTFLVTRPVGQADALSRRLERLGARVREIPTIRISDPPDPTPLRRAARRIQEYEWVVFTSVNGVEKLRQAMAEVAVPFRRLREVRVAAIGPATARALAAAGVEADVVPPSYRAEALVRAIRAEAARHPDGPEPLSGVRVLLPRAEEAREVLPDGLRALGGRVDVVPAYVTETNADAEEELRAALEAGEVDWITFTSSSTVRAFVALAGRQTGTARVAVIGPITARTARDLGIQVEVIAAEYTIPGLVRAIAAVVVGNAGGVQ
ncbi:MAG: uroporphyrinogen-III synthase [Gemmatimonadota bacterium]